MEKIHAALSVIEKYRELQLEYVEEDTFLISNHDDHDCMVMSYDDLETFFKLVAEKVEKLHVIQLNKCSNLWQLIHTASGGNLRNVTYLICTYIALCEKDVLLIAENYPKLCELQLMYCKNKATNEDLMVEQGLSISTMARMTQLKSLEIDGKSGVTIGMSLFCELITNVPLECLKLKASLKQDMHDQLISKRFRHHLKELKIGFDSESLKFFERTGRFKNLLKLHLHMNASLSATDSDLQNITKAFPNLECLTMESKNFSFESFSSRNFDNVTNFVIPPNLKELSLDNCRKSSLIIDILDKSKIEKFRCRFNGGGRVFEDFNMLPYMDLVHLEEVDAIKYNSFFCNNNILKELHWYGCVSEATQYQKSLKTCRNLENLIICGGHVPLDVLVELKHLHKLQIQLFSAANWPYIIGLLKHPTLKELRMHYMHQAKNIPPAKGFPSTITRVFIVFNLLGSTLDFWLDMLQQNPTMVIESEMWGNWALISIFLKRLIRHENLPMDLTEITVRGFNLNCRDLRKKFSATTAPLKQLDTSKWVNPTLVLRRKQT